ILEAPHLVQAAQVETVGGRAQAHAAVEGALEYGELAVGLESEQEELPDLVRRERDGELLLGHPRQHLARGGELELRAGGGGFGGFHRWAFRYCPGGS